MVDDMGESAYGYTGDELTSVTTPSMVYTFGYNPFGSHESVSAGGNKIARYLYNAKNGKLRYVVYGNGYVERYDYDELNRIESVLYHENGDVDDTETEIKGYAYTPLIEYRYDGEGNLSQYYDGIEEAWYLYRYDIHGRIESVCRYAAEGETLSVIEKTAYTYDGNSRLSGIQGVYTVNGKAYPYAETYGYDGMGRLTGYTGNGVTTAYSYTTMGDVSTVKTTYGGFSATTVYTYESVAGTELSGRIEEVETFVEYGAAVRSGSNYSYEYDEGGNITEIAKGNEVQYRYSYDDLGQLIREENVPEQKVYVYEYDDAGNILRKKTYSYYGDPSGEADSVYQYGYGSTGWKDRLLSYRGESITYDDLGNPLSYYNGSSYSFTWEKGRQLSQAVKGSSTTEFIYDAEGRRIGKIGAGGMTTTYVWEGELLIAEYREGYDETIYLYDANGSPIGFRYKDDAGYYTQGVYLTFFYEKNPQGDIIGILDENGYRFVEYSYDAWGNLLSMEYVGSGLWSLHYNMAESNPFRYRGYYYDRETGFYYLRSRYYDPVIGRFLNADGQLNGGLLGNNLYAYCENNPVNRIDPTGEAWWHWALGAGVVAICAIATVITAGGFAAAAGAVIAVGNGIAAATTASTVAAGAFIGSATVLGMAAMSAAASSGSMQEFYDQGNWGTVAMTAASAVLGGVNGYTLWKTTQSMVNSIPDNSACFVAGTMIETENGSIPIEEITAGMLVYAHDPKTGKTELKEVVQTFVRETDELVHIEVNGEEILTTPTHPFWVPQKGWTDAIQLRAGDRLQLLNGEYVVVEQVQHELLESPVTVYNFEVEDFHTYYVTGSAILVHNANCNKMGKQKANAPWSNQRQNQQFDYVVKKYNLTKEEARRLHNKITSMGLSKEELIEELLSLFPNKK